jgi:hypothetical protein
MRLQTSWPAAAGLALALALALPRPSTAEDKESFSGTVLLTSNMAMPAGRTYQITINVEEWTSAEDRQNLLTQLKEGGEKAVLKAVEKMKAGYILPPAWARQPSWRIAVASTFDTPKGRVVRLFTDRPIAFVEAYQSTRSMDYPFGAAQFVLNEKGEGEGVIVPAARIALDEEGRLVFETLPHSTGPQKLLGVKSWSKEYKKK